MVVLSTRERQQREIERSPAPEEAIWGGRIAPRAPERWPHTEQERWCPRRELPGPRSEVVPGRLVDRQPSHRPADLVQPQDLPHLRLADRDRRRPRDRQEEREGDAERRPHAAPRLPVPLPREPPEARHQCQ